MVHHPSYDRWLLAGNSRLCGTIRPKTAGDIWIYDIHEFHAMPAKKSIHRLYIIKIQSVGKHKDIKLCGCQTLQFQRTWVWNVLEDSLFSCRMAGRCPEYCNRFDTSDFLCFSLQKDYAELPGSTLLVFVQACVGLFEAFQKRSTAYRAYFKHCPPTISRPFKDL